jgi:hypothetical protein
VLGLVWENGQGTPRFLLDPAEMRAQKRFAGPRSTPSAAAEDE